MMVADVFRWWGGQLSELLRLPYQHRASAGMDGYVLNVKEISFSLGRRHRGIIDDLGEFSFDQRSLAKARGRMGRRHRKLMLLVDPQFLLERNITLPISTGDDPGAVIRYDIDRLTPFEIDEIYLGHSEIGRNFEQQAIAVRLSLVARSVVDVNISRFTRYGLHVRGLTFQLPDGSWRDILVTEVAHRSSRFDRMALRICAGLAMIAFVAAVATPIVQNETLISDAETTIAALQPAVAEVDKLRRYLTIVRTDQIAVIEGASAIHSPLITLAALTDILPDDTYITEISISGNRLTLRGQSSNAARLISLLSDDRLFRSVIFSAPVTHASGDTIESFAIQANIGSTQ